jgi:hypothetical protein
MEDSAYLIDLFVAIVYLVAGARLMGLYRRSGETPERSMALAFLLLGISYLFYQVASLLALEHLWMPLIYAGRVACGASCLMMAVFTRQVFRPGEAWATGMVWTVALLISTGTGGAALEGDWEGMSLGSAWFWFEWVGMLTPFVWAALEGFAQYVQGRRRVRLGLCDPIVCNRFLLWGFFGAMQLCTYLTLIPLYLDFKTNGQFSVSIEAVLGAFEMLSVGAVWLVFFSPASYRSWVRSGAASA